MPHTNGHGDDELPSPSQPAHRGGITEPPPSPRLLSCFLVLGAACALPWSSAVLALPWVAAAATSPPAASPGLRDGLPSALALVFSACNAGAVLAVARFSLVEVRKRRCYLCFACCVSRETHGSPKQRLPPAALVVPPLALCSALLAAAACAADADARGDPLSGALLVTFCFPAALFLGVASAVANCGCAALAAEHPTAVMRSYTAGQALAGLVTAAASFLAAAAVEASAASRPGGAAGAQAPAPLDIWLVGATTSSSGASAAAAAAPWAHLVTARAAAPPPPRGLHAVEAAVAWNAARALAAASVALVACLAAFVALPPHKPDTCPTTSHTHGHGHGGHHRRYVALPPSHAGAEQGGGTSGFAPRARTRSPPTRRVLAFDRAAGGGDEEAGGAAGACATDRSAAPTVPRVLRTPSPPPSPPDSPGRGACAAPSMRAFLSLPHSFFLSVCVLFFSGRYDAALSRLGSPLLPLMAAEAEEEEAAAEEEEAEAAARAAEFAVAISAAAAHAALDPPPVSPPAEHAPPALLGHRTMSNGRHGRHSLTSPLLERAASGGYATDENNPSAQGGGHVSSSRAARAAALKCYERVVFLTYAVSLSLYPGVVSFLRPLVPRPTGSLLVPALFVVWNGGDTAGRLASAAAPRLSPRALLAVAICRAALAPALLACNVVPPDGAWRFPRLPTMLLAGDAAPVLLVALLALSNGALTAVSLSEGPACAPRRHRGAAATQLVAFLVAGIMVGSAAGLAVSLSLQRQ